MEQEYEFRVILDGVVCGMDVLMDVSIKKPLIDRFDVGLACCAQMVLSYWEGFVPEPSNGASVKPQFRIKGSTGPWKPLGTFYIDERTSRSGKKTLTCFDSMIKADAQYPYDPEEWDSNMVVAANKMAAVMGVEIDPRTYINPEYTVDYPDETSMRTAWQYIAAAHGGNWIVTDQDKLLLVPMFSSMPPETYYLITQTGEPILIGGDRILV